MRQFKKAGVGLITLDSDGDCLRVLAMPAQAGPQSKFHYLYALGQMAKLSAAGHIAGAAV